MANYLDETGLSYLKQKLDTKFYDKVDKEEGKALSTNDYTTTEKNKLAGIATGANKTVVDTALNNTSTNPVQNKVVNAELVNKVDKVEGKALSTNDYTTEEKSKLAGIATGANKYTLPTASASTLGGVKVGTNLTISSGVLSAKNTTYSEATTSAAGLLSAADKTKLDGIAEGANKYTLPKATTSALGGIKVGTNLSVTTDGVLSATDTTYEAATTTTSGLLSSTDKAKLDGIAAGATKTTVDTALSSTSTNPVQNKVINTALNNKVTKVSGKQLSTNDYTTAEKNKLAAFGSADTYALKSDLSSVYKYQGSVATVADLPETSTAGYVYNVEESGMNYAWNGTAWDALGGDFAISPISNTYIDSLFS